MPSAPADTLQVNYKDGTVINERGKDYTRRSVPWKIARTSNPVGGRDSPTAWNETRQPGHSGADDGDFIDEMYHGGQRAEDMPSVTTVGTCNSNPNLEAGTTDPVRKRRGRPSGSNNKLRCGNAARKAAAAM